MSAVAVAEHKAEIGNAVEPDRPVAFSRVISTPPGAPWDQSRAARLEARMSAPLPSGEVAFQMRRLGRWGAGTAGRFGVIYVRADQVGARLDVTIAVDGRDMDATFISAAAARRRDQRRLAALAGFVAATAIGLTAAQTVLARREAAGIALTGLERSARIGLRQATATAVLKTQTALLDGQDLRGRQLSDVMDELAWASAAKAGAAQIQAFHWDDGFVAVEAAGDASPFEKPGRPVQKSPKPIRGDVWLWGWPAPGAGAP